MNRGENTAAVQKSTEKPTDSSQLQIQLKLYRLFIGLNHKGWFSSSLTPNSSGIQVGKRYMRISDARDHIPLSHMKKDYEN